jgi:phosphoglycolate phosphatase-like HAD superfamily hydrolase
MIKNIIFDFDGVILDSIPIKTEAFIEIFKEYNKGLVDKLIEYHIENGGISRYEKIRYFFNELVKLPVDENIITHLADQYSNLTKKKLSDKKYLINDTISFVHNNYQKYNMHIASGADESDLHYICNSLNISKYFISINGSPTEKKVIVENILNTYNYEKDETVLIGDSKNDLEAAKRNNIEFYGYNNQLLDKKSKYIVSFLDINKDPGKLFS